MGLDRGYRVQGRPQHLESVGIPGKEKKREDTVKTRASIDVEPYD